MARSRTDRQGATYVLERRLAGGRQGGARLIRDLARHGAVDSVCSQIRAAGSTVAGETVFRFCLVIACLELVAFVAAHGTAASPSVEADHARRCLERAARW